MIELSAPAELLVPVDKVTLIVGEIKLKYPDQFLTGYMIGLLTFSAILMGRGWASIHPYIRAKLRSLPQHCSATITTTLHDTNLRAL